MKQIFKDKKRDVSIILIGIGVLALAFISAIFSNGSIPEPMKFYLNLKQPLVSQPGPTSDGCKLIELDPKVSSNQYNTVSSLDFIPINEPDKFLEIDKDQGKRIVSLGKFELPLETYTILKIPKLWLYFSSEALSNRSDKLYGLEDSYLSAIILKVGNQSQEVKLGKTGEHVFIELDNCPFGNIYPLSRETKLDFEIFLEVTCNNFENGACLDNGGKPLDYINGADLTVMIRLFAESYQNFTHDISIPLYFKY